MSIVADIKSIRLTLVTAAVHLLCGPGKKNQFLCKSRKHFSMQMAAQSKILFCFVLSTSVMSLEKYKGNREAV